MFITWGPAPVPGCWSHHPCLCQICIVIAFFTLYFDIAQIKSQIKGTVACNLIHLDNIYLVKASWNSPISFCDKKSAAIVLSTRGCIYINLHKVVHISPVTERFKKGKDHHFSICIHWFTNIFSYWHSPNDNHQPKRKRMGMLRRREDSKLTFMPILAEEVLMGEVSDVWWG
jgi:hypothetical protein